VARGRSSGQGQSHKEVRWPEADFRERKLELPAAKSLVTRYERGKIILPRGGEKIIKRPRYIERPRRKKEFGTILRPKKKEKSFPHYREGGEKDRKF